VRLYAALAVVWFAACGADETPAPVLKPAPARSPPPRTGITADELARLREGVARLQRGMTRSQVFETLGVSLEGLGQMGDGPQNDFTTIYLLGGRENLYLTWDGTDPDHVILLRGFLLDRDAPGPGPIEP
jgi:hypothetical protein